jgi:hypothetical protein
LKSRHLNFTPTLEALSVLSKFFVGPIIGKALAISSCICFPLPSLRFQIHLLPPKEIPLLLSTFWGLLPPFQGLLLQSVIYRRGISLLG